MSRAPSASKPATAAVATPAKAKVNIIYYSMYGHVGQMAKAVLKGVEAAGAEGHLIQVPETLSAEVLQKMHAPEKDKTIPTISFGPAGEGTVSMEDAFANCDGILFGIPTRFGGMPAQFKAVWDATGGLWQKGALVGKPAGIFFATSTQGGGQETTALTSLTNLVHHGMLFVPNGYSCPLQTSIDELHGGSPYGAGTITGSDGSRQPSQLELQIAEHQGKHFTQIAIALKNGRAAATAPPSDRPASSKK